MKYLTNKELIEILSKFDGDLPVIITREEKGHQYGVTDEDIQIIDYAYFGNDNGAQEAFPCYDEEKDEEIERKFLNIGSC